MEVDFTKMDYVELIQYVRKSTEELDRAMQKVIEAEKEYEEFLQKHKDASILLNAMDPIDRRSGVIIAS